MKRPKERVCITWASFSRVCKKLWLSCWCGHKHNNFPLLRKKGKGTMCERGQVFLDKLSRPYLVKKWGGSHWLFYWHPDKRWVSLRKCNPGEVFPINLTQEQQDLYFKEL